LLLGLFSLAAGAFKLRRVVLHLLLRLHVLSHPSGHKNRNNDQDWHNDGRDDPFSQPKSWLIRHCNSVEWHAAFPPRLSAPDNQQTLHVCIDMKPRNLLAKLSQRLSGGKRYGLRFSLFDASVDFVRRQIDTFRNFMHVALALRQGGERNWSLSHR
jgi:hypothetical protein